MPPSARSAASAYIRNVDRMLSEPWHRLIGVLGAAQQLAVLGVPSSLVLEEDRHVWFPVHRRDDSITAFELPGDGESSRSAYNQRMLDRSYATRKPVLGYHAGFWDLFVPIVSGRRVQGHLVSGPFSRERLTAAQIRHRFEELTCGAATEERQRAYARAAVETPVLGKAALPAFTEYMVGLASLFATQNGASRVHRRQRGIIDRHFEPSFYGTMWDVAAGLTDPIVEGVWAAGYRVWDRERLGLAHLPTVVIALALPLGQTDDPVLDEIAFGRAFAERCAALSTRIDNTISGRAGPSVAYLLCYASTATAVPKIIRRVRSLLGPDGRRVRAGISRISPDPRRVPRCLSEAMLALDWATHSGKSTVYYEEEAAKRERSGPFIFRALPALCRSVAHIDRSAARVAVEQLVGEIVWHSGANLEVARAHVAALYSQAAIAGAELSLVEPRVMSDLAAAFGERTMTAGGLDALGAIFREHVLLLVDTLARPEKAGQEAKLERILRFIDLYLEQPLTRTDLARLAGYAPAYLSRLFRRTRHVSLEQHILGRRLERAKELLRSTDLGVTQVAASSGFPSAAYFHRAFKAKVGTTPDGFRAKTREVS